MDFTRARCGPDLGRCRAKFCTLPDYASPSVGRVRCGGVVRIRGGVGQSGSDFNEGMHNLAGVQISAKHQIWANTMLLSGNRQLDKNPQQNTMQSLN